VTFIVNSDDLYPICHIYRYTWQITTNMGAKVAMLEKPLHRSHPNLPTVKKIKELVEYRELYRKQMGKLPTWTSAINRIGIAYRTVKRQAPELFEKWDEEDFHF